MASKVEPIPIWRGSRPKRRLAHYAVGADDVRAPRSKTPNDGQQTRRVNPLRPDLRLLRWRSRCWRTDTFDLSPVCSALADRRGLIQFHFCLNARFNDMVSGRPARHRPQRLQSPSGADPNCVEARWTLV